MALLPQPIEAALSKDDVRALSAAMQELGLDITSFYDWQDPKSGRQQRDLLSMAAAASAATCVTALLAAGASCNAQSPSDGNTALHCACSNAGSNTARVIALLVQGGADKMLQNHAGHTAIELLTQETTQAHCQEPAPAEESDLLRPEYSTDEFRMFSFKIDCCPRLAESHDWTLCPFQHPGEKARRRDPRCYTYQGVPCPDFRKGTCKRGDACTYAHGVFECWLHPSRYRTQLCKEGAACRRGVCFFAHSVEQLREPTMTEEPGSSEPTSPYGPILPAEESQETVRSWSPTPAASEDSIKLTGCTADSCHPAAFLPQHLVASADSSMSSTPVLDGPLASAISADSLSLQRTLSSLSLGSDDVSQALHRHVGGLPTQTQALLAATAAAHWPLQMAGPESLALAAGLHNMLLPDSAAVEAAVQAAAMQHQLAMLQAANSNSLLGAASNPSSSLLAAAGMRQPLRPLSVNLGHVPYHHAPNPAVPSCYGLGL